MRTVWEKTAVGDLYHIREFIRQENPSAAEKTGLRIESAVKQLALHPEMGRAGRRAGTKELMISDIPYRIVYRVHHDTIQILRIYHTRRKWPPSF